MWAKVKSAVASVATAEYNKYFPVVQAYFEAHKPTVIAVAVSYFAGFAFGAWAAW